ncbi:ketoacyl-synt-domain-containing protein [Periconia macrospinosa]|uniref:Ketoacyl-synt-domain-containing protein n=1 Tax=Periconia macrospinosa TaxID=97972 RepID=A0A2V1E035_9PLEO|nr:ketoacyl-synt-domain-containing protein [Periconia macrospinosa]
MAPFMEEQKSSSTSSFSDDAQHAENPEIDGNDAEPIAIIGFSFKFPDEGDTPEGFWNMLLEQRNCAREFPADRINVNGHYRKENRHNSLPVRGGNFLKDNVSVWDADFFSISPVEANALDPMQQKLLEVSYHAFENAGLPIEDVSNTETSVYTGSFTHDYMLQMVKDTDDLPTYAGYGVGSAMLANRISHFFNLMGPSIAVDSACSSSAMALDMAVQSLRTRSSSMGLVAGCNMLFAPETYAFLSNMNMLSKDSRSYSFDSRANGYARGEGIAVMIVKRLDDAIRDGNTIRAIIRATGANEDGKTPGITQPSQHAQQLLIDQTYARAGLSKSLTRYCEAHGTGTPLGDPLESGAIGKCFRDCRSDEEPMYLGSVKSNIGHTEGASGLAGVIKAVYALEHGLIPPNADFREINPRIDTKFLRVKIPTEPTPWPTTGVRRISINSFGYGGANCHVVLDDAHNYMKLRGLKGKHKTAAYPPGTKIEEAEASAATDRPAEEIAPKLIVLSTSDEGGIQRLAGSYGSYLMKKYFAGTADNKFFNSLAYTLDSHRSKFPYRTSIVARSTKDLLDISSEIPAPKRARSSPLQLGFVFTGQGAQWHAMGRELLVYPIYRQSIEEASAYLNDLGCKWSALEELGRSKEESKIDDPEYSQTLCTVVQVALVDLLEKANVKPVAVVGHSSGEIGAAYAGRYISKQSAWKVAYSRGVVASKLTRSTSHGAGAMMAVGLPEEEARPYIAEVLAKEKADIGLIIACVNSPSNVTVAGDDHLIDALLAHLNAQNKGIFARKLRVQVAYHSPQMQAVAEEYLEKLGPILKGPSTTETIPMISSVTGKLVVDKEVCNPTYWLQNMVSPVLFSPAVKVMCGSESAVDHLVELGPHAALGGPLREILKSENMKQEVGYSSVLVRNKPATNTLLQAIGNLWCENYPVNVRAVNELDLVHPASRDMLIELPAYAFDHSQEYRFESRLSSDYRFRNQHPHDFLGSRSLEWSPLEPRWRLLIRTRELPWIADHVVDGRKVYPGTGMLVMAIEAAKELADPNRALSGFVLRDVDFSKAMELEGATEVLEVITSLRPKNGIAKDATTFDFEIISYANPDWLRNIRGSIEIQYEEEKEWDANQRKDFAKTVISRHKTTKDACTEPVDESFMYKRLKWWGLDYGPSFRKAKDQFVSSNDEALATIETMKSEGEDLQPHIIHPATFDAIGHLCFTAYSAGGKNPIATAMPSTIDYAWVSSHGLSTPSADAVQTCVNVVGRTPRGFQAEITGVNPENTDELRVHVKGCTMAFISEVREESEDMKKVVLPNPEQQWYHVERKPDLALLSSAEIEKYIYQQCGEKADSLDLACKYIELAAHQNPGLQILQLGSGDEAQTQHILSAALDQQGNGVLTCAKYDIADTEEKNLASLQKAFTKYGEKMSFHDLSSSNYKAGQYDLVIVLDHDRTPENFSAVLQEAKKSIKSGGRLIAKAPILETSRLEEELNKNGLSKPGLSLKSPQDTEGGIVVSEAATAEIETNSSEQKVRLIVVGDFANAHHTSFVNGIKEQTKDEARFEVVQTSLAEAPKDPEIRRSILILLSDPEHLCLESMSEDSLALLQTLISFNSKVLWVSNKEAEKAIGGSPVSAIIEGSARSLRMENSGLHMVVLTLAFFEGRSVHHVLPVLKKMVSRPAGSNYEQEYFEVDGRLHTDRLINSNSLKEAADKFLAPQYVETVKIADHDFKLEISQFTKLDTLHFVEESDVKGELGPEEIEVRVNAVSIESRDHRKVMGKGKNQKPQFGNACAGVVIDSGRNGAFKTGDRVLAIGKNSFRSRVRTLSSQVIKLPDTVDFVQACEQIPALTALLYAVTVVGRWRAGQSVMVYPCTGFIGDAAIQICQKLGANVSATVYSEEKSQELSEHFNIPKDSIYSHQAFSNGYRPGFKGADIVLCLQPPSSQQDWTFVNRFGSVVYVPSISGSSPSPPTFQLPTNVFYSSFDFQQVVEEPGHSLQDSLNYAINILSTTQEEKKPAGFPASQLAEAFKHIADENNNAVVVLDPEEEITLTRNTKTTLRLDPNATYVISGGTGGIGRSMTRWCAAHGARNLILLSRSGAKSDAARELVSSLTAQGVRVEAPPCNTSDLNTLRAVLDDCLTRMPPIKGAMQSSGAYKDLTFDRYTLEGWNQAIKSKATSSWNLHTVLPSGMDFFIMLSSVSGLQGAISMSSYAGANSYQDGLARHRISLGEKATAICPAVMHDVGFVTEFSDAQKDRLSRGGWFVPTWDAEIRALLDIYCDPASPRINDTEYRPIMGIRTIAQVIADGNDVPFTFTQPLWGHSLNAPVKVKNNAAKRDDEDDVNTLIKSAASLDEAAAIATKVLRKHLSVLLSMPEERLQDGSSVDSLIAIELRNWLGKKFEADIPVFEIVSASTWSGLGTSIAEQVRK